MQDYDGYYSMINKLPLPTCVIQNGRIRTVNLKMAALMEKTQEEIAGQPFTGLIHPSDRPKVTEKIFSDISGKDVSMEYRLRLDAARGEISVLACFSHTCIDNSPSVICQLVRLNTEDFPVPKKNEEELGYISLHDPLTGLYNRTFFNYELVRLEGGKYASVSIIMCYIEALEAEGDDSTGNYQEKVIKTAAALIKECFRKGDIISRIEKNKIAILLTNISRFATESACYRIRVAAVGRAAANQEIAMRIFVGFAISSGETADIKGLLQEAENNMYYEKQIHNHNAPK